MKTAAAGRLPVSHHFKIRNLPRRTQANNCGSRHGGRERHLHRLVRCAGSTASSCRLEREAMRDELLQRRAIEVCGCGYR